MNNAKQENPITSSIDLLFTLIIFWSFTKWTYIFNIQAGVLLAFLYVIIINDWLSCRASFEFYTQTMFVIDVVILFLFLRMVDCLVEPDRPAGYEIDFWSYLAALSILYGIWDYIVAKYTKEDERAKDLKSWGNKMLITGFVCILSYVGLQYLNAYQNVRTWRFLIFECPPFFLFMCLIILWNKEKFQLYKELERTLSIWKKKP